MSTVHIVKFRFELQTQLDFFLMVFCVLQVVLLQFQSHLSFILSFPFNLFAQTLQSIVIVPKHLFIVSLLQELLLVIGLQPFDFCFLVPSNFTDQHLIVSSAAVLKQNGEDFPHVGNQSVLALGVLQALFYELVKANGVHKKSSVNPVY